MIYWLWLTNLPGIGVLLQRQLLDRFGNPKRVYFATKDELILVKDIGVSRAETIINSKSLELAESILKLCKKYEIQIMTLDDECYPNFAKEIYDMPILLYFKGNARRDSIGSAVVGSRRCSKEGKERAIKIAYDLVDKKIPVISGMAKGIDSYAHTACLKAGGYTVAVLACGLNICYPSEHKLLKQRIEENGLLLSEYPPNISAKSFRFPKRNRIIAAWSREIYIPEAGRGSGALITADYGKKYGRSVVLGWKDSVVDPGNFF